MIKHNLTDENYFSKENSNKYCGSSQFKDFFGALKHDSGCEARAVAKLTGEYTEEMSKALLVGSYVDSYFEGTLDLFKAKHPSIFKKNGDLKADYIKAEEIIGFVEKDALFMQYMSGDKQTIMTGAIGGVEFKIKIDSYHKDKAIVDLKVMKSIRDLKWSEGEKLNFIEYWGYDIQAAIYQEIVYQNTGKKLPFFIAVVSKENVSDKEIIYIDDEHLEECLYFVKSKIERLKELKYYSAEPRRCEKCDYCKATRILKEPVHYLEIGY